MPKPDVEMLHSETGRVYYNGRIYDVTRMATGWVVCRPCNLDQMYTGHSVEDCCAWLTAQHITHG